MINKVRKDELMAMGRALRERALFTNLRGSEKGIVLVVVLVLSAVSLIIMTTLIYMITTGTQVSGLQKRYKTALEAGVGGGDIFYELIALRGEETTTDSFIANLNSFSLNAVITTSDNCSGSLVSGATYSSFAAKLITPTVYWNSDCNTSLTINTGDPNTYDMRMELGTTTKYTVYAKIVATTDGNSGGDEGLLSKGVVASNSGEVAVTPIPYLYAIEMVAVNNARPDDERAKLSIVYQY